MIDSKSEEPGSGRDPATGRFQRGNPGGPGNPHAKRISQFRSQLLDAVTVEDLRAIISAMVQRAKEGDESSARIVLDYCCGGKMPSAMTDESADGTFTFVFPNLDSLPTPQ